MRKTLVTILMLIVVGCSKSPKNTTPLWYKVANENDTINKSPSVMVRWGNAAKNCWSPAFTATFNNFYASYTNFTSVYGVADPCSGSTKEVDIAQTTVPQPLTVNGIQVVVPIQPVVAPPIVVPPNNAIPVVLNGVSYGCTSILLDNTGTLTLTCVAITTSTQRK